MIHHTVPANSENWELLRLGIPTSSEFSRIVTPTGKLSEQSRGYMFKLVAEWYYGAPLEDATHQTAWMARGNFMEEESVNLFQFETGLSVSPGGFFTTDDGLIGSSPDRLLGDSGVLEIKSPSPAVHMQHMLEMAVDAKHKPQTQGQLYVCEREFGFIQSYCPAFPTVRLRFERDEKYIALLAAALSQFNEQMLEARLKIEREYGPRNADVPMFVDNAAVPDSILGFSLGRLGE